MHAVRISDLKIKDFARRELDPRAEGVPRARELRCTAEEQRLRLQFSCTGVYAGLRLRCPVDSGTPKSALNSRGTTNFKNMQMLFS
jgi:hypothetical protein